jgi:hypothetical protein
MGKKRITQLLEQLQANQQQELQNAAAIFTVAQVAVNQLQEQMQPGSETINALPAPPGLNLVAPIQLDKAELKRRYGSYAACRQAAKKQGIVFSKTPTWQQLATAFAYIEAYQKLIHSYMQHYPTNELRGVYLRLFIN